MFPGSPVRSSHAYVPLFENRAVQARSGRGINWLRVYELQKEVSVNEVGPSGLGKTQEEGAAERVVVMEMEGMMGVVESRCQPSGPYLYIHYVHLLGMAHLLVKFLL